MRHQELRGCLLGLVNVAFASALLLPGTAFCQTPIYRLTDLGDLPGGDNWSAAQAINDAGQVVGCSFVTSTDTHAYLWSPDSQTMLDLGTLPGRGSSCALDINESGRVVGFGLSGVPYNREAAFVWDPTTQLMTELSDLEGGYDESAAVAVTDSGDVVGWGTYGTQSNAHYDRHAVLWHSTTLELVDLGDLPGGADTSYAYDVNDLGQIVGQGAFGLGNLQDHAVLIDPATRQFRDLGDLGDGGNFSRALGINNSGWVVGVSLGLGPYERAFVWSPISSQMTALPVPSNVISSSANAINDRGEIVGSAVFVTEEETNGYGVIWLEGSIHKLIDLIYPGDPLASVISLIRPTDINNHGQIAAVAYNDQTQVDHGFILTPMSTEELFESLLGEISSFGPGKSLRNIIIQAEAQYDVDDVQATCAMLTGFVNEAGAQSGKKLSQATAKQLIADAHAIETAIGC